MWKRLCARVKERQARATMNWFWLSVRAGKSARMMCDQHVVKMPLEACQLLFTTMHARGEEGWDRDCPREGGAYVATHINHPIAIWARLSVTNFVTLATHAIALCREYSRRYEGRVHACQPLLEWMLHAGTGRWKRGDDELGLEKALLRFTEGTLLAARQVPAGCSPVPVCPGPHAELVRYVAERTKGSLVAAYRALYCAKSASFAMRYKLGIAEPPRWLRPMTVPRAPTVEVAVSVPTTARKRPRHVADIRSQP